MALSISIRWSEEVDYESEIELADEDIKRATEAGYDVTDPAQLKSWLTGEDEAFWFEQCDTSEDCYAVTRRSLDDVEILP